VAAPLGVRKSCVFSFDVFPIASRLCRWAWEKLCVSVRSLSDCFAAVPPDERWAYGSPEGHL